MTETKATGAVNDLPNLMRACEAAEVLAISVRKLWELTNIGEIRCVRIGRCVRYDPTDLRQWIAAKKT